MPQPIQFQPATPQAVHPQIVYQPESQHGFMGNVGQAFNLVKGAMDMFKTDPREQQVADAAMESFMTRYDAADSPEAKKAVVKQALAYADKTGNDSMKAAFEASDPSILSQTQKARKNAVDWGTTMDERGQRGDYASGGMIAPSTPGGAPAMSGPAPAGAAPEAGGAASPSVTPPGGSPSAAPPSGWGGEQPPQEPGWVGGGQQVVNSESDTQVGTTPLGPGAEPPPDLSQGMVDSGSDTGPIYHPVQVQAAQAAGVSPEDVMVDKDGYPTVKISAIAQNPKLPMDAILRPPAAGPEDALIGQVRQEKTIPATQQWARDVSSLRMWNKIANNQTPDAGDMLGFAVTSAQADMMVRDLGAAAGIMSPEASDLGKIGSLAVVFRGKFDPSKPEFADMQKWYANLSPQEQKVAISLASSIAQSGLEDDKLQAMVAKYQSDAALKALDLQQGQQKLALEGQKFAFDQQKWKEQQDLSLKEMASREGIAAADRGLRAQDLDIKRLEYDQRERFKALEADNTAYQQYIQLVSLLDEGDKKAKSYISIAESARASASQTQQAINANETLIVKYRQKQDPIMDQVGKSLNPDDPGYNALADAKIKELEANNQDLAKRLQEDTRLQQDYIKYATNELQNSKNPRAQKVTEMLGGGTNPIQSKYQAPGGLTTDKWLSYQVPGMDAKTFAQNLKSQFPKMDGATARNLWAQYQKRGSK